MNLLQGYSIMDEIWRHLNFTDVPEYLKNFKPHSRVLWTLVVAFAFLLTVAILKNCCCPSKKFLRKKRLGKRPIKEIVLLKDVIEEIHFASCNCGKDPSLAARCRELILRYPEACNTTLGGHNYTPFLRACWNGCTELIKLMISIGADLEAVTDAGEGAVYLATYGLLKRKDYDFTVLSVLLEAGVDINQPRHDGYTALHLAAARGRDDLVRFLLAHGADTKPWGSADVNPAALALMYGHKSTAELLETLEYRTM